MRAFLVALALVAVVGANDQVEVNADKFYANDAQKMATFTGNVKVTRDKDLLTSNKLIIHFDDNKNVTSYEAIGDAKIDTIMNEIVYFGSGDVLIYEPAKMLYTLKKNAFVHDKTNERKVYGEVITINQQTGVYEVDSKPNEPVKFLFQMQKKD